jgi:hypothetical protein
MIEESSTPSGLGGIDQAVERCGERVSVSLGRRGEGEQDNVPIGDCASMKTDGRLDEKARIDAAPTSRACDIGTHWYCALGIGIISLLNASKISALSYALRG